MSTLSTHALNLDAIVASKPPRRSAHTFAVVADDRHVPYSHGLPLRSVVRVLRDDVDLDGTYVVAVVGQTQIAAIAESDLSDYERSTSRVYVVPEEALTTSTEVEADVAALIDAAVVYTDKPLDAARAGLIWATGAAVLPLKRWVGEGLVSR